MVLAEVRPRQLLIIRPLISTKIVPECRATSFNRLQVLSALNWFLLKCRIIVIGRNSFRTPTYDQVKCASARRIAASAVGARNHFYLAWLPETHPSKCHAGLFVQHGLPGYFVTVAGVLEVFGGGLIILGFLTRIAALLLAMEMAVAIWKVHSAGGYMAVHNYEFPLVLAAACFALATVGAGRASVDYALFESGGARPPRPGKPKGKP